MKLALAVLLVVSCDRRPHVASCQDDLGGVWSGSARWMILDERSALEVYPVFTDNASRDPEVVAAPRVIDLRREGRELAGELTRRYMRRADLCEARVPVRITSCQDDTLEVELADPLPPVTLGPCSWPPPAPPHVERWHRE